MHASQTLFETIWREHVIARVDDDVDLLGIDRHLVHEVSSAEAFRQLAASGRPVAQARNTFAVHDHIVSTQPDRDAHTFAGGTELVTFLERNCAASGIRLFGLGDPQQGIVHVTAAENGLVLPGATVVCGDSHTATLGAFGALAWGIGTTEVAHVLATQALAQKRPKPMAVRLTGSLRDGTTPKDAILAIIGRFGITAGVGHAVEYRGPAIRALDMEGRMTICNMSIELGARFGLIAPDDTTFQYLAAARYAPKGAQWDAAVASWRSLRFDDESAFAKTLDLDVSTLPPQITWGTTPGDVISIDGRVPNRAEIPAERRSAFDAALVYMGLTEGQRIEDTPVDVVFIGSCTNSRLSDLRAAAAAIDGRHAAPGVRALVVPGSTAVRRAAEREGLDRVFRDAGFEWRESGCSMCLGMNDDVVPPRARCLSTSNRNFEGRQGALARTHLASPVTAVATAIAGRISDPRRMMA
jgi:3-isopropylmalate/(R)-2-methylmalate dehydratase large subunit